jgi:hypothetical protein
VEAAAITPTVLTGTPSERIKSGSTGFLAMVELKMASPPMMQRSRKGEIRAFILPMLALCNVICNEK